MSRAFHIGVYGVLLKENSLLLIEKTRGPYKGWLDLPGGSFEHGETPEQTLQREIEEETGVVIEKWRLMDNIAHQGIYAKDVDFHHVGLIYEITSFDPSQVISDINVEDVAGCLWVSDPNERKLSPFAAYAMRYLGSR